jgi:hypothetical protein
MSLPTDVAPLGHYTWTTRLSFPDTASRAATMAAAADEWFQ